MSYTITHFYRFGDFALDADQRVLLRADKPVPLTPKVFETLLVLVERHGRIVGKEELMGRLWPNSFVEEANLTFNVQRLRRALGDNARQPRYVETVSRRGYRFIAQVEEVLTDTGGIQSHITVRPNQSERGERNGFPASRGEQRNEPLVADHAELDLASVGSKEANASGLGAAIPASTTRRRIFVTAIGAAAVLLGTALSAWHFGTGSNGSQYDNRRAGGVLPPALPVVKVEKLTETGKNRHAVISPDGEYMAYTAEAKGRHGIWLRQLTTGADREIVSLSERLGGLTFAHSGKHLYFMRGATDSWAMYRVALPLGGVPARLIDKPQGTFSLSPDDSKITFIRYSNDDRECALMIADADGSHERTLAVHAQPDRFNTPAWSPDGRTIVVATGPSDSASQEVRVVAFSVADGSEREVSADKWFHISRIAWLPDQSGLLIVASPTVGKGKQIWRMSYPGGEVSQITDGPTSYADISITADASKAVAPQVTLTSSMWVGPADEPQNLKRITHATGDFCWTPDERLVYSSRASANLNLWVMQPDGTEQKQLTDTGERNATPTITPDGRYIIFTSNRTGALQIWRMDADGSNPVQLTKGKSANSPAVSPDGRWVVYNAVDDWTLWRISIDGGQPVRLTESYAVNPSVSPDGKLIACVGEKDDQDNRKLLVITSDVGETLREINMAPLKLSSFRLSWTPDGGAIRYAASHAGVSSIYRQSFAGGAPERMIELKEDDTWDFGYSPDGQQLAVTRGDWQFDIVLLSGLNP